MGIFFRDLIMRRIVLCAVLLLLLPFASAETRVWKLADGRTFEAEFIALVARKVALKNKKGKQIQIPLKEFSGEDLKFIQLSMPPRLEISFSKKTNRRVYIPDLFLNNIEPTCFDYIFGVSVRQTSSGSYTHELQVEFFAIGTEIHGDRYILLDRQAQAFTPTKENSRSTEFKGKTVSLTDYIIKQGNDNRGTLRQEHRGRKYSSYLVVITDSRGKIVAHETPKKWLFENYENLKQVPVGKYFDKTCTRVGPTRPKTLFY